MMMVTAMVVMAATAIVVIGGPTLSDASDRAAMEQAELAMAQFASEANEAALDESNSKSVTMALDDNGELDVEPDAGTMNITVREVAGTGEVREVVWYEEVTMGAVVYELGDERVAYQGGGVWRANGDSSVMVSPPGLSYRDATLTVPAVTIRGEGSGTGDRLQVVAGDEPDVLYPDPALDRFNPLLDGQAQVTVQSDYYLGWAAYFEERTDSVVTIDHDNDTVVADLVVPFENPTIDGGLVDAGSQPLVPENNVELNSYDSADGNYTETQSNEAVVISPNDITLENKGNVTGDVKSGGTVTFEQPNTDVTGNVFHAPDGNAISNVSGRDATEHVGGDIYSNATVDRQRPVDRVIDRQLHRLWEDNDNDGATLPSSDDPTITNNELDCDNNLDLLAGGGDACYLPPGQYYLNEIDLGEEDAPLILNATEGNIDVAVAGDVDFDDQDVEVTEGDGEVRFYIDGDFAVRGSGNVSVPEQRSTRNWVYTRSTANATVENNVQFVGVLYGPGNPAQSGTTFDIGQNIEVFGAIVGDVDYVPNSIALHYDRALHGVNPVPLNEALPRLTYLHISENRLEIKRRR